MKLRRTQKTVPFLGHPVYLVLTLIHNLKTQACMCDELTTQ